MDATYGAYVAAEKNTSKNTTNNNSDTNGNNSNNKVNYSNTTDTYINKTFCNNNTNTAVPGSHQFGV